MSYKEKYDLWLNSEHIDENTKKELIDIGDEKEIEDRFYKELEFGTGGLRGVIGAGSNRMNKYTVGKATQGLANYLLEKHEKELSVAIAYDSRNMSVEFAEAAALILCANKIKVYLFETLQPTPMLSYTVRHFNCSGGIVITASHNPKQYNGYKVYGADGGQVTDKNAKEIITCVQNVNGFSEIKTTSLQTAKEQGYLTIIGEDVERAYIDKVKGLTIRKDLVKEKSRNLKIIYTPIHGSGNIPIRRVLQELGYGNLLVVKEQEAPDGDFPTAPYPNPEEPKVFEIAIEMAKKVGADIIFGTDPDCDRIGVVVKDNRGEYVVLTGNQTGVLLTQYILSSLKVLNKLPQNGVVIKTIVTTEMIRKIAETYNVEIIDVLTGFKYIGEKIKEFEENKEKNYIFGFEESFGYLSGDFVRDKDAVSAAMLVSEMALYYKERGMSLYDALSSLYEEYGYYRESLISIDLEGKEGQEKIQVALDYLRHSMKHTIGEVRIKQKIDYKSSIEKNLISIKENAILLPKSNVLKFVLENENWFVVRPSGTEPKMKIYLSTIGESLEDARCKMEVFKEQIKEIIDSACNV